MQSSSTSDVVQGYRIRCGSLLRFPRISGPNMDIPA